MKTITFLAAALAAALLAGSSAHARIYPTHSVACQPTYGNGDALQYDTIGVGNPTGSAISVVCPATATFQTQRNSGGSYWTIVRGDVWIYDQSDSQPLSCTLFGLDAGGWATWGPTKYSCSASGGCPDPTSSFMGVTQLTWTISSPLWTIDMLGYVCTLPPPGPYTSFIETVTTSNGS